MLSSDSIYNETLFEEVKLREETKQLAQQKLGRKDNVRLNRMLLEDAYPGGLVVKRKRNSSCKAWPELGNDDKEKYFKSYFEFHECYKKNTGKRFSAKEAQELLGIKTQEEWNLFKSNYLITPSVDGKYLWERLGNALYEKCLEVALIETHRRYRDEIGLSLIYDDGYSQLAKFGFYVAKSLSSDDSEDMLEFLKMASTSLKSDNAKNKGGLIR